MELPQTNADEADEALVAAPNPLFLHTANRTTVEQQLSPHQGMHTHRNTFIFFPTFFISFPCPRLGQSHWNRRQGCHGNRGLAGVFSAFYKLYVEKIYVFCFLFFIRVLFWLGFVLCWKDICFLISVFDNQFLISVFWFLFSDFCFLISVFWFLFPNFWFLFRVSSFLFLFRVSSFLIRFLISD